ncbi:Uncharacterised protein [uncultured archaeon]|nr:Uncharacterised protein [uncultured archaeon]
MKYLLFLLLAPAVLACVVPENGMRIDKSMDFCTDVFYLDRGVLISGNNINIECNGAVLKSWSGGRGITIEDSANVTINGCRILNYNTGFYVKNSARVFLNDNHLVKNMVGSRFVNVSDSATFNHDVSLQLPFEVFNSTHNVFSLTNKLVDGKFCSMNFCNEQRNSVFLFVAPKATEEEMSSWLFGNMKTAARLRNWIFGSF